MAQKVVTTYVDDLTGEESSEIATHSILIDGAGVELDLTDDNYEKLLEILNPYLHADGARRIRGAAKAKAKGTPRASAGGKDESAAIRAWAKDNNIEVNDRGRVPAAVREAYEKAH
ncbi:Lsr2 family protein [Streptomyces sp. SID14478]|uniref:histone-like nucleoid-structuring protein Lsr2 n=1 Tax=Streptomyces sp. SID14478 TaxID=2706073 RepID=UPI0013DB17E6|nr:Lsr2 family protein [Streptomyces sp. SID14478]NEB73638.1 Lsr2 family protein [Streptomyces sp. SID14478]